MTATYTITNTRSGLVLGQYTDDNEAGALDAMARDAGYSSYAALNEAVPARAGEIRVTETALVVESDWDSDEPHVRVTNPANGDVLDYIVQYDDGSGVSDQQPGLMISSWSEPGIPMWDETIAFAERAGVTEQTVWDLVRNAASQYLDDLRRRSEAEAAQFAELKRLDDLRYQSESE